MNGVWAILLAASLFGPLYALAMGLVVKRGAPERPNQRNRDQHVVVMVPCLNEGLVVTATVERLLALDPRLSVLVLDDASDDDTPAMLARIKSRRVHVVRRDFPNARQGKGAALNEGLRHISRTVEVEGRNPDDIVIAVFDADGWADPETLDAVMPWFTIPDVGAAQIGVRINNRQQSLLARMQDLEFVAYTEIFQSARNRITSTGLGGNGQFARLSALHSLGPEPWTDSLTEDLDLGIRLRINGWRSMFDGSVAVHQQGLHNGRRLVRQRTRWFQGHLQAWNLLPRIWRAELPLAAKLDLSSHLLLPAFLLLISVGVAVGLLGLVRNLVLAPVATLSLMTEGPFVPWWYLLGFSATPLIASAYWRSEPVGFWRGLGLAHLYAAYTWVWFPAGWRALWRQARGTAGWAKTTRTAEPGTTPMPTPILPLFDYDNGFELDDALAQLGLSRGASIDAIRQAHHLAVASASQLDDFRGAWRIRSADHAMDRALRALSNAEAATAVTDVGSVLDLTDDNEPAIDLGALDRAATNHDTQPLHGTAA